MLEDDTARTSLCLNTRMRFYLLLHILSCSPAPLSKDKFHQISIILHACGGTNHLRTDHQHWSMETREAPDEELDDFQSKINILLHLQIKNNREHVCTILYPCKPEIQEHCCIFGYLWPMILVAFTQTWFHMVPYRNAPLFSHISIPVTSLDLSVWVGYVWIRFHTLPHSFVVFPQSSQGPWSNTRRRKVTIHHRCQQHRPVWKSSKPPPQESLWNFWRS